MFDRSKVVAIVASLFLKKHSIIVKVESRYINSVFSQIIDFFIVPYSLKKLFK